MIFLMSKLVHSKKPMFQKKTNSDSCKQSKRKNILISCLFVTFMKLGSAPFATKSTKGLQLLIPH